ncbi:hypothetical protein [Kibdelosporangium aridum]|uniref:Uncharacterized protein n=1 Tax=Kibdelosporangium aridum TaxID=2030 RepID=A0A1Y5Y740_KIBAR|nr:hypothetical protein [Kibdelosporangium aridum]SMD26366.1 hypothetical protein SAMN05661093_09949 [Kibdelosporangium aridum]
MDNARSSSNDWTTTYQELDDATLLSLVPILAEEAIRWKKTLDLISQDRRPDEESPDASGSVEQVAMSPQGHRHDVASYVDDIEVTLDLRAASAASAERYTAEVFRHLVDLTTRRRWILDVEGRRRGLLPQLPSIASR